MFYYLTNPISSDKILVSMTFLRGVVLMIDLHCHALFGVDDGAQNVEIMQQMLDTAYSDGIRAICFTPHFKHHHFKSEADIFAYNEKIKQSFSVACDYIAEKYADLKLYLGNEIMYHHDIYTSITEGKCSKIADTSYALIEFLPTTPFFEISSALLNLLRKGIRPILAHVERYGELADDISRVKELREGGVLIQVNASSITKLKFGKSARFIKRLFKSSLVDLIATDAHDANEYAPIMSSAVSIIEKKYGEKMARRVSLTVPNMILENQKKL